MACPGSRHAISAKPQSVDAASASVAAAEQSQYRAEMRFGRLILIAICSFAHASVATAAKRPNVVFILADQWRAAATGYAGDPNIKTPNLDRLEAASVNF